MQIIVSIFLSVACADWTNPHTGTLEPSVLSEVFSSLWNKHLVSAANLVIAHAKQYRYERQVARACLCGISFNLHMENF
jgi:hypothetical protein